MHIYVTIYIRTYSKLEFTRCRIVLKLSKSFVITCIMSRSPPYKYKRIIMCAMIVDCFSRKRGQLGRCVCEGMYMYACGTQGFVVMCMCGQNFLLVKCLYCAMLDE